MVPQTRWWTSGPATAESMSSWRISCWARSRSTGVELLGAR